MASGVLDKGTALAGYRIDGVLGRGGMGVVYEATQVSLDRVVALKVLAEHLTDDITFQQRFRREGKIQAQVDHPNIVTVYDSGSSEHGFFIAMRLVRGPNLKDMIVSRELDPGRTLRILGPVAGALSAAHEAGLIHRDIKPQNVLVGGRDHAYLADFGLTKGSTDMSLTATGTFVGTLDYISPEQIKGDRATTASDIYALAAVLYECLTGVVPFPKESEAAVLYAHMADPPPRVSEVRPDLPARLDDVFLKAMSKDPAERHTTAGELLEATTQAFSRRVRAAFTPPGPIEVPEETGVRPAEQDVSTRETRQPESDEVVAGPTASAAPPAPTAVPESPPETRPGEEVPTRPAPVENVSGPEATRVGDTPDTTRVGDTPDTRVSPEADTTRASAPADAPPSVGETESAPSGGRAPAAPAREPRSPRTGRAPASLMAGAVALGLLVIVGGFLLGRSGSGGSDDLSPARAVSAGPLELNSPGDWTRASQPPEIPGLSLASAVALAPSGGEAQGTLVAGLVEAENGTLLPSDFLQRLSRRPAQDDAVKLGELEAYRYKDLAPRGFDRSLTVYTAPTQQGVATIACAAPNVRASAFLAECEGVAATAKLTSGTPLPLGVNLDYLDAVDRTVDRLNALRASGVRALRRAKSGRGQAVAGRRLAGAYRAAAVALRHSEAANTVAANTAIVKALGQAASAYRRLAASARRGSRKAYDQSRKRVSRAEADVKAALKGLEAPSG